MAQSRMSIYTYSKNALAVYVTVSVSPSLCTAREADQYYWEEPEVYLQPGPHGPHYILHDFCASGDLDTDDLSGITVSGLLRCQVYNWLQKVICAWHLAACLCAGVI